MLPIIPTGTDVYEDLKLEKGPTDSKANRSWWIWSAKFGIQKTEKQKNWPYGWIELLYCFELLYWRVRFSSLVWENFCRNSCVAKVTQNTLVIWLYKLSCKCKLATVTSLKADVSSVSPSSERRLFRWPRVQKKYRNYSATPNKSGRLGGNSEFLSKLIYDRK